ncbi:MAG: FAD binding domain-containing protein [Micromonosporaceae bacterium]
MVELLRPRAMDEAVDMMARYGGDAIVYGGGTAIQILLRQGVLAADAFVDLSLTPGLDTIAVGSDGVAAVGPMVSLKQLHTEPQLQASAPLAALAYRHAANPRVRNTATVAGNIAHGDYRLDPPGALTTLDASITAASVRGQRTIPAREFFVDVQLTALEPDEIVTGIRIPAQPQGAGHGYAKLSALGANDWPAASAAALLDPQPGGGWQPGHERLLRLGIGALAPTPLYLEVAVTGLSVTDAVGLAQERAGQLYDPLPDVRGSVAYKRRLGAVAIAAAVRDAWRDCTAKEAAR